MVFLFKVSKVPCIHLVATLKATPHNILRHKTKLCFALAGVQSTQSYRVGGLCKAERAKSGAVTSHCHLGVTCPSNHPLSLWSEQQKLFSIQSATAIAGFHYSIRLALSSIHITASSFRWIAGFFCPTHCGGHSLSAWNKQHVHTSRSYSLSSDLLAASEAELNQIQVWATVTLAVNT